MTRNPSNSMKRIIIPLLMAALLSAVSANAVPLNPNDFDSLGATPFTIDGTYTIDTSGDTPTLYDPNGNPVATGVVASGIAVFTFNDIVIGVGVNVVGLQNADSRPVALLSKGDIRIDGTINVSGADGAPYTGFGTNGGAGGAAGPGGGGGGGGGGGDGGSRRLPAGIGGAGGVGFANGSNGGNGVLATQAGPGGDGGNVVENGAGGGGSGNQPGGGGAFGGNGGNGYNGAFLGTGVGGTAYGDLAVALQGGSGGGGGGGTGGSGGGGGGGGGAVEIGGIGNVNVTGSALANGGISGAAIRAGGGGAGGGILVHGDAVILCDTSRLSATGGNGQFSGGGGGGGRIYLAANTISFPGDNLNDRVDVTGGSNVLTGQAAGAGVFTTQGTLSPQLLCNQPPVALCHDVTVSADANCSATASIDNGSSDPDGDTINVSQSPPGPYPLGQTSVTLTVTDSHGASSSCVAMVTVIDDTPPTISCPSQPVVAECTGNGQANVSFTVTATDTCDGPLTPTCTPASGSSFSVGSTTVNCSVADAAGNSVSCTFDVVVQDTQAPVFGPLADIPVVTATSVAGAVVSFACPNATDTCEGSIPGTCSPPSGSTFAPGQTTVNVSATDSHSNTGSGSFKVTVIYGWSGFLTPIPKQVFGAGSTIPIKFRLTGASAGIKNLVARGYWAPVNNNVAGAYTLIGTFKYDPNNANYVLNWSTKPKTTGTFRLKADLGDGVLRTVDVILK